MKRFIYWAVAAGLMGAMLPSSTHSQTPANDPYQALVKREYGTAIKEMEAIEKEIQDAKPTLYPQIEARLITVLETPEATMPGKQFACQMLRLVGSAKCVSAVGKLLADDKLSHAARNVLLGVPDPAAAGALRAALGQTQGKLRTGIIDTIGDRGDKASLETVAALLKGADDATANSTLNAVGKIGGAQAADVLDRAKAGVASKDAWAHAYLRCAASLGAGGSSSRAEKMYLTLFEGDYPSSIRAAALPGLAQTQKEKAVPIIVKTLSSDDAMMRRAAAAEVASVPGNAATRALARALSNLTAENKAALLGMLAIRGDAEGATDIVNKLAADENEMVRQAAIKALGRLGSAASIPVLTAVLKQGGATASDANRSLVELQGKGVVEAMMKQADAGDVALRETMLKILADRGQAEALPLFRKALNDPDAKIRQAALKTIAATGTREDMVRLVEVLVAGKNDSERAGIAGAISDIGLRMSDTSTRCEPVLQGFAQASPSSKASLLGVLASLGGDKALDAARASLSGDAEVRKAAIHALADWPDPAPMPELLNLARGGTEQSEQILALRGYIRLAGLLTGNVRLKAYRDAMSVAVRPEEKWLVLAGLTEVPQVDSLKMVEASLSETALQREAFLAYEKIAEGLAKKQPAVAKAALERVVADATDNGLRKKATTALEKLNK